MRYAVIICQEIYRFCPAHSLVAALHFSMVYFVSGLQQMEAI